MLETIIFWAQMTRYDSFLKKERLSSPSASLHLSLLTQPLTDAFNSAGTLIRPKSLAINKIGHALHSLSAPFCAMTLSQRNRVVAADLGFHDPRVLQSMVICKQPEIGGAVPPHQDSAFLYTDPPSAVGFWYALEDANAENGCLSFVPGSHKWAPIKKRFVRCDAGGTGFEELSEGQGDGVKERFGGDAAEVGEKRDEGFVMGEVKSGDLVLIDGNVLHKSERNTSGVSRWIYTFHVSIFMFLYFFYFLWPG